MDTEHATLQRIQSALYQLRLGLTPFVAAALRRRYGEAWRRHLVRANGTPESASPDEYSLLKTMIDRWNDAFDTFPREVKPRVRSFVSLALDARNTAAHAGDPITDAAALRYLDAIHELLCLTQASAEQIQAVKALYNIQRDAIIPSKPAAPPPQTPPPPTPPPPNAAPNFRPGTIPDRLLAYIRRNPGLDDDQLSRQTGITPRQTVNIAARRLEAQGLIRRSHGPLGKIVNHST